MAGKVQDWLPNLQGLVQNENVKKFSLFQNYWKFKKKQMNKQTNKKTPKNGDNKAYETRTVSPAKEQLLGSCGF